MPFNLVRDPWLPVIDSTGARSSIRPAQVVERQGGRPWLSFDTGRAEMDMACLEFLAGLLAVACPPSDRDSFAGWYREPPSVGELDELFSKYEGAFDIGGDGFRFMQDPRPRELETVVQIHELLLASGAGERFFDPVSLTGGVDRPVRLGSAGAGLALFAHQITATSGGRGYRTSPRGGGPLTTVLVPYVKGANGVEEPAPLWQRVWLNVPTSDEDEERPLSHFFPWMWRDIDFGENPVAGPTVAREQVMFPMPRRVVVEWAANTEKVPCDLTGLVCDEIATTFRRTNYGLDYPSEAWAHPFTPRRKEKPGSPKSLPVRPSPGQDTLGDWAALTLARSDGLTEPAPIVTLWKEERSDAVPSVKLHMLGFATDNAKVEDFIDRTVPVIHASDPAVYAATSKAATDMIAACEAMGGALRDAVKGCTFRDKDNSWKKSLLLSSLPGRLSRMVADEFFRDLGRIVDDPQAAGDVRARWPSKIGQAATVILDELRPLEDADPDKMGTWLKHRRFLGAAIKGTSSAGANIRSTLGLPPVKKPKPGESPGNDETGIEEEFAA